MTQKVEKATTCCGFFYVCYLCDYFIDWLMINSPEAAITMEGPAGVSQRKDAPSPINTDIIPLILAVMAIFSGLFEIFRAVAAGIIKSEVINNAPIIFIAMATSIAISSV